MASQLASTGLSVTNLTSGNNFFIYSQFGLKLGNGGLGIHNHDVCLIPRSHRWPGNEAR